MLSWFESDSFIYLFPLAFPPYKLLNIANGVEQPLDIEASLLDCHKTGKKSFNSLVILQAHCTRW